jgi:hypothetical protein
MVNKSITDMSLTGNGLRDWLWQHTSASSIFYTTRLFFDDVGANFHINRFAQFIPTRMGWYVDCDNRLH